MADNLDKTFKLNITGESHQTEMWTFEFSTCRENVSVNWQIVAFRFVFSNHEEVTAYINEQYSQVTNWSTCYRSCMKLKLSATLCTKICFAFIFGTTLDVRSQFNLNGLKLFKL